MDKDLAKTLNAILLLGQWQFELAQEALQRLEKSAGKKFKPPRYLKLRGPARKGRTNA